MIFRLLKISPEKKEAFVAQQIMNLIVLSGLSYLLASCISLALV